VPFDFGPGQLNAADARIPVFTTSVHYQLNDTFIRC